MRVPTIALLAAATLLSGCITTDRQHPRKRHIAAETGSAMPSARPAQSQT